MGRIRNILNLLIISSNRKPTILKAKYIIKRFGILNYLKFKFVLLNIPLALLKQLQKNQMCRSDLLQCAGEGVRK